ncbi:MAG TPA: J domain-containing protein [Mesorhizobium sp.]|jgi:curved DNA-binding protein CbpA|nr:J domain-containing protein [Mesorhizobium sp.]
MNASSKYFEKIRIRADASRSAGAAGPLCQWDGCEAPSTHRAPVGRMREGEYFRFCFDHVREYNKGYNYFSGLGDGEIARFQKEALTGHRPTWRMGTSGHWGTRAADDFAPRRAGRRMRDPFNLFGDKEKEAPRPRKVRTLEGKALDTLGLEQNASADAIKARYKELVKRHHPDANGGDRGSEDRLRDVLQAYRTLRGAGLC